MLKNKIVLASSSQKRKEILNILKFQFEVKPTYCKEYTVAEVKKVDELVKKNSFLKLEASRKENPDRVIIAADTLVYCDNKIMGKPGNKESAFDMLLHYRENPIEVYTALSFYNPIHDEKLLKVEKSTININFKDNSILNMLFEEIYSLESSGGFSIEGKGAILFDNINGSFYNILGLPIHSLFQIFLESKLNLKDFLKNKDKV